MADKPTPRGEKCTVEKCNVTQLKLELDLKQSKAKMCNGRRRVPLCPGCANEK